MTTWIAQGITGWRKSKPPKVPIRLPYAKPNRLQRNRWKAAAALFVATLIYVLAFQLVGRFMIVQFLLPLVILLLMTIWALPEMGAPPRKFLTGLLFAFLIALLLWPDYLAIALPGMPWITALRLTGFPLALITLYCLSTSRLFKGELRDILGQAKPMGPLLAILAFAMTLSVIVSNDLGVSANKWVVVAINWACIFIVSAYVFKQGDSAVHFACLIWIVSIIVCLIGLWEARNSQIVWANSIPSFLKVEDEAVQRILSGKSRAATGIYRVQSKFTTPLGFAEFLALASPFVLHFALSARLLIVRLAAWLTMPLLFLLVVKTDSRLGAAGFFLTLIFFVLVWGSMKWHRDRRSLFGPAITLAYPLIFAAFILATFFVGRLRGMVWGTGAHQFSDMAREVQWGMALPKILMRPWGHGVGQGAEVLGYTNRAGVITIDSYYLSVGLEIGWLGIIGFYGLIIAAIILVLRNARKITTANQLIAIPCAIALTNFLIIKSVLSQQENHPLAFAMLGLIAGLLWSMKQPKPASGDLVPDLGSGTPSTLGTRP
jgi:hypothetical protein